MGRKEIIKYWIASPVDPKFLPFSVNQSSGDSCPLLPLPYVVKCWASFLALALCFSTILLSPQNADIFFNPPSHVYSFFYPSQSSAASVSSKKHPLLPWLSPRSSPRDIFACGPDCLIDRERKKRDFEWQLTWVPIFVTLTSGCSNRDPQLLRYVIAQGHAGAQDSWLCIRWAETWRSAACESCALLFFFVLAKAIHFPRFMLRSFIYTRFNHQHTNAWKTTDCWVLIPKRMRMDNLNIMCMQAC